MAPKLIRHYAGDPKDQVQRCIHCGIILSDHREIDRMVPDGWVDGPRFFEIGPVIQVGDQGWVSGEDETAVKCTYT